jgi:hypothetical protein
VHPDRSITEIVKTQAKTSATGDRFAEKIPSVSDSVTWLKGRHTMKAGFGFQQNNDNQVGNVFSRYTFSSIANYLAAKNGTTTVPIVFIATDPVGLGLVPSLARPRAGISPGCHFSSARS